MMSDFGTFGWLRVMAVVVMVMSGSLGCSDSTSSGSGTTGSGTTGSDSASGDTSAAEDTAGSEDSGEAADTTLATDTETPEDVTGPEDSGTQDDGAEGETVELDTVEVVDPTCPVHVLDVPLSFQIGSQAHMVTYDNQGTPSERKVTLVAPNDFDPDLSYPLFFLFHGSGGADGGSVAKCKSAQAAGKNVLCVVPLGVEQPDNGANGWNLGGGQTPEDDVAFVHAIWHSLKDEAYIDSDRVFALGTSMGSAFAGNVLTNQSCSFFSGIVQSATPLWVETVIESPGPMGVLMLHGEEDKLIPIDGGVAFGTTNLRSANESLAVWAAHSGCPMEGQPVETETEDYTRVQYEGCDVPMVLYRLKGQGHGTSIQSWYQPGLFRLAIDVLLEGNVP